MFSSGFPQKSILTSRSTTLPPIELNAMRPMQKSPSAGPMRVQHGSRSPPPQQTSAQTPPRQSMRAPHRPPQADRPITARGGFGGRTLQERPHSSRGRLATADTSSFVPSLGSFMPSDDSHADMLMVNRPQTAEETLAGMFTLLERPTPEGIEAALVQLASQAAMMARLPAPQDKHGVLVALPELMEELSTPVMSRASRSRALKLVGQLDGSTDRLVQAMVILLLILPVSLDDAKPFLFAVNAVYRSAKKTPLPEFMSLALGLLAPAREIGSAGSAAILFALLRVLMTDNNMCGAFVEEGGAHAATALANAVFAPDAADPQLEAAVQGAVQYCAVMRQVLGSRLDPGESIGWGVLTSLSYTVQLAPANLDLTVSAARVLARVATPRTAHAMATSTVPAGPGGTPVAFHEVLFNVILMTLRVIQTKQDKAMAVLSRVLYSLSLSSAVAPHTVEATEIRTHALVNTLTALLDTDTTEGWVAVGRVLDVLSNITLDRADVGGLEQGLDALMLALDLDQASIVRSAAIFVANISTHTGVDDPRIVPALSRLLFMDDAEVVASALRILANYCEGHEVAVVEAGLGEAACILADHSDPAVIVNALGVLLNLSSDRESGTHLLNLDVVSKVMEILSLMGLTEPGQMHHDVVELILKLLSNLLPVIQSDDQIFQILDGVDCITEAISVLGREDLGQLTEDLLAELAGRVNG
ncbi:hypothetical protein J8273_4787 [Carpediemonas membranifera]|uniref:Uncharacterized protein n=1 Tax=Carpediemonas membranifera TaxID=201153 RepID=A0A8J6E1N0_9EUKA|nr:hypothetical protein J8273_4787 [Carpediemonas membranifera]|eukprot:KAG9393668.1 hypothetical protein J8273_4787 [Carpediemonas membranifera]